MPQISRACRMGVYNRVSDLSIGLNAKITAAASGYPGIDTSSLIIPDWSPGNTHFLFGRVNPDDIEASDWASYPLVTIDTAGAQDRGEIVSATFSGVVQTVIDVHISWEESATLPDFASYGDLVEDAMFATLNTPNNPLRSSSPGSSFVGIGKLASQRGPIQLSKGDNWRQTFTFTLPLRVIAN